MDNSQNFLLEYNDEKAYVHVDYGKGVFVYSTDGARYIDGISGIHVANIGHGVSAISDEIAIQLRKIAFINKRQFIADIEQKLAESIVEQLYPIVKKVFFVSSGSEANEAAIQVAQRYHVERGNPFKTRIIGRWHSYHGNTAVTLAAGGHLGFRRKNLFQSINFPHIQAPHCYRCTYDLTYPDCGLTCAKDLELTIQQEDAKTIAAFIAEPIIGTTGGAIVPPPGYYETIREICDKYEILFIADEVITGFGRTGKYLGIQHWNTVPDIITAGKGLGCGYAPICSVMISEKVWEVINGFRDGLIVPRATFGGNPVSCAAAFAVQKYISENHLIENCNHMGVYLDSKLNELASKQSIVGVIRGKGLLLGIELVQDKETRKPFPRSMHINEKVVKRALDNGLIIVGGSGTGVSLEGDHLLISPPFIINSQECDLLVSALDDALSEIVRQTG